MTTQRHRSSGWIKKKLGTRSHVETTKTVMLWTSSSSRKEGERSVWWRRAVKWHERSVPRESEGGRTPIGTDASYRCMKHRWGHETYARRSPRLRAFPPRLDLGLRSFHIWQRWKFPRENVMSSKQYRFLRWRELVN